MSEKDINQQSDFMIEKIKEHPINRKKLLKKTLVTVSMAIIFGLVASVTFLFLQPVIKDMMYPEEKPSVVVFPEDPEEMAPEDMLVESLPLETMTPNDSITDNVPVELEKEQIDEILSQVVLDKNNYKEMYTSMASFAMDLNKYVVTVTAVTSNMDWFNTVTENKYHTSGLILTDNGMELLILVDATILRMVSKNIVTFSNGVQAEADIKLTDGYTNLAVLSIPFDRLPADMQKDSMEYPTLGSSSVRNILGLPVIAIGSPMGNSNSIGYGMITSATETYSVADRNYKIIQTDIHGSNSASGVLFNMEGFVIGFITENRTNSDMANVIYAYGITDLRKTLEKLSNGNTIAYLGISGINVTNEAYLQLGVPMGGYVTKLDLDSPAMLAGIQQGDIITTMNERKLTSFTDYTAGLMVADPGSTIKLTVLRRVLNEYKEMKFVVVAGEAKR